MEENIVYNKLDARGNVIGGIVLPAEFEDEAEGILECQKLTNWLFWEKRRELSEAEMAKAYLDSTDWYIVRFVERGIPVPEDISAKRAEAVLLCQNQE